MYTQINIYSTHRYYTDDVIESIYIYRSENISDYKKGLLAACLNYIRFIISITSLELPLLCEFLSQCGPFQPDKQLCAHVPVTSSHPSFPSQLHVFSQWSPNE